MKITDLKIDIHRREPSPTPKCDALQALPGSGAVRVTLETEYHGFFGLVMFGIAAIDTAIWDCLGKARGVPCWQLWGGVHQTIRAYAMVGWLNYSDTEVQPNTHRRRSYRSRSRL